MTYTHGIKISEQSTSILPPRRISASLPVVFGTAPVHLAADGPDSVNKAELVFTYPQAVAALGYSDDWDKYTICEFMKSMFSLFNMAPVVFINVFDPAIHKASVAEGADAFVGDEMQLPHPGILTLEIKNQVGDTTFAKNIDYTYDIATGLVTRIDGGGIAADADVTRSYDFADPTLVDSTDIIGGVDGTTGALTGLELLNRVFPSYRLVPGQVVANGWSHDPAVAAIMTAKAGNINGCFKADCLVDIPESVTKYTDVPAYKNDNNLTDEQMTVCWPKVKLGEEEYWLSTQLACLTCQVDADHSDIPSKSPSNERLQMTAAVNNGAEVWLGPAEAQYLNGQGIFTALNFIGGWKSWGNRTGAYPAITDPKDAFRSIRRMFNWIGNTLILTWWSELDNQLTRRQVETVLDSNNLWFNGLSAREFILGGRVTFDEIENPVLDLMDGISKFHVFVTPPSPNVEMDFILEYDPTYLSSLF